jgi:hypothetical protein
VARLGRHTWLPFLAAGAAVLALVAVGETSFGLAVAPTLLLLAHLLVGRFPGERLLANLSRSLRRGPRAGAPRRRRPEPVRCFGPRGGLLIAASLSGRAPPIG